MLKYRTGVEINMLDSFVYHLNIINIKTMFALNVKKKKKKEHITAHEVSQT